MASSNSTLFKFQCVQHMHNKEERFVQLQPQGVHRRQQKVKLFNLNIIHSIVITL